MIVKFEEGHSISHGAEGVLESDLDLEAFDTLVRSFGGRWRLSYPRLVRWVQEARGDSLSVMGEKRRSIDLYVSVYLPSVQNESDQQAQLDQLSAFPGVERHYFPREVESASKSVVCSEVFGSGDPPEFDQEYLGQGRCGGIGAEIAWRIPGGDGSAADPHSRVRVFLCDDGLPYCHVDLPPFSRLVSVDDTSGSHGTHTLSVMGAPDDGGKLVGIAHGAEFYFGTYVGHLTAEGVRNSLDAAAGVMAGAAEPPLRAGDVIVLPLHSQEGHGKVPIERDEDITTYLQVVTLDRGITVVEAAGNGGSALEDITEDSGAILVGAGVPVSRGVDSDSNHGKRVDCQGWAADVDAADLYDPIDADDFKATAGPGLCSGDLEMKYIENYTDTSSATAVIGGLVASLQGAARAVHGEPLEPLAMRQLLRDAYYGQPQENYDRYDNWIGTGEADVWIGPLPDLRRLLRGVGVFPDAYIRDSPDDSFDWTGFDQHPLYGAELYASPDIIPQIVALEDPTVFLSDASMAEAHPGEADGLAGAAPASKVKQVYVRMKNRGAAPDAGSVHVFWAPPSTYIPQSSLTQLDGFRFEHLAESVRMVGGVAVSEGLAPATEHVSWITATISDHDPLLLNDLVKMFVYPIEYAQEYYTFRYRNIGELFVAGGGTTAAEFFMRGFDDRDAMFELVLGNDLPAGSEITIEARGHVVDWTSMPGFSAMYDVFGSIEDLIAATIEGELDRFSMSGVWLRSGAELPVELRITVPAGTASGEYQVYVEQHTVVPVDGNTRLGRYNYRIHVE